MSNAAPETPDPPTDAGPVEGENASGPPVASGPKADESADGPPSGGNASGPRAIGNASGPPSREKASGPPVVTRAPSGEKASSSPVIPPIGEARVRGSLRLAQRALLNNWDIPPDVRADVISACVAIVRNQGASNRERMNAVRALIMADAVNVRRERNVQDEHGKDVQAAIASLRAALTLEGNRELLAQLTHKLITPPDAQGGPPPNVR